MTATSKVCDAGPLKHARVLLVKRMLSIATEDEWLAERAKGIGASDAPIVLGISPYKTPYQLWSEKVGLIEPPDYSDREWIEWGHRLEPIIAKAYAERSGRRIDPWPQFGIVRHKTFDWMACTPDAVQWGQPAGFGTMEPSLGMLQVKAVGGYFAAEWKETPPLHYQVQLQHELEVTDCAWGTLAALIGGQKLLWFDFARNDKFIAAMLEQEAEFWRRVEEEDPPEVDESPETTKILQQLHPQDNGESIALPPAAVVWDEQLDVTKEQLKELDGQKRLLENRLRAAIGDATFGCLPDGSAYSYKTQTANGPAKEASTSTFRVLRKVNAK